MGLGQINKESCSLPDNQGQFRGPEERDRVWRAATAFFGRVSHRRDARRQICVD